MSDRQNSLEITGFQERAPYNTHIDLQTDFVMVYGIDESMPERISKWKEKGYVVHLMTGVSWGEYQDYLYGKFDGRVHWDEAQKRHDGSDISHGKDVPYMVPTIAFSDYLTEKIKVAVDAGVEAIHLEEPEFWVDGGYSDSFKREWEIHYGEPWMPPHESVDAQFRASKLKAYLYTRSLDRLCGTLKEYAKVKYNRNLRFYVPTHSLINYSQWRIISPESRLLDVPVIDGYIAQIWTGTSRTKNVYQGERKERTFETAFLEYGIMQELVRGTNRRMWFLHDPIEDNPNYTWEDYKKNYYKTVVASLLHPKVFRYEVSPWPNRVFNRKYPKEHGIGKEKIPSDYATSLLVIMNTLRNMNQEDVKWSDNNLTTGLLLADSGMFQRYYPSGAYRTNEDSNAAESSKIKEQDITDWSAFYGLALPLLKHGVTVRPVQLDNVRRFPNYLDDYKVLLLSYEFMKPEYPDIHNSLAQWVLDGGILVYVGDDSDSYHNIRAWWNEGKRKYKSSREHLFECMGLRNESGLQTGDDTEIMSIGKGILAFLQIHPIELSLSESGADLLRNIMERAVEKKNDPALKWVTKNNFILQRGPYTIATVIDESITDKSIVLEGLYVDLFDPSLRVIKQIVLNPGENALLYDLEYSADITPKVVASSARIDRIDSNASEIRLTAIGPEEVPGVSRIFTYREIQKAEAFCKGKSIEINAQWEEKSKTVLLTYTNNTEYIDIILK